MSVWTVLEMADKHATLAINAAGDFLPCWLMPAISGRTTWIPLYLALAALLIWRLGWKKAFIALVTAVVAVAVCDQFSTLIKNLAHRYRPCWDEYMVENGLRILEKKGGKFGFFSAHAATLAGIATVIYSSLRKDKAHSYCWLGWILSFWVLLVGMSRIFVGKHFLGDVIVGTIVGFLFGWAVFKLSELVIKEILSALK